MKEKKNEVKKQGVTRETQMMFYWKWIFPFGCLCLENLLFNSNGFKTTCHIFSILERFVHKRFHNGIRNNWDWYAVICMCSPIFVPISLNKCASQLTTIDKMIIFETITFINYDNESCTVMYDFFDVTRHVRQLDMHIQTQIYNLYGYGIKVLCLFL